MRRAGVARQLDVAHTCPVAADGYRALPVRHRRGHLRRAARRREPQLLVHQLRLHHELFAVREVQLPALRIHRAGVRTGPPAKYVNTDIASYITSDRAYV